MTNEFPVAEPSVAIEEAVVVEEQVVSGETSNVHTDEIMATIDTDGPRAKHLKDALRTFRVVKTSLIIPKTQESDPSDQRHYTYYKEAVEDVEKYKCRAQKEGPSPSSIIEVS